jgi:lysine 2,3-aminomutase
MSSPRPSKSLARRETAFRRRAFPTATAADWNDWRWQLRHRARTAEELARVLEFSARERRALAAPESWRMPLAVTPYFLSLLADEAPDGPLRRTMLPDLREARIARGEWRDPLGEEAHQVAPGLIRSYPHKALWLATSDCACFCRYCTRSRTAGKAAPAWTPALAWLKKSPEIHDVLVSGGDPLTLGDAQLARLLKSLRAIPHVELIRIGTKIPAVLPQRVTPALVRLLKRVRPLWLSLHFTHPGELTPRAAAACQRLLDAGLPLMNQTVLLRGINDDLDTLRRLNEGLLRIGVKPYYLHQGDLAAGTAHLRSTIAKGRAILRDLCGLTTGYAIPHFMLDQPGGGGKISLGLPGKRRVDVKP